MFNFQFKPKSGQTIVTLLFFIMMIITITTASVTVIIINSRAASRFQQGGQALSAAESGVENALVRLLRDPDTYTGETLGGDVLNLSAADYVTIAVSGSWPTKTITSQAYVGNSIRTIQAIADYTNNILTISSWREIQ